MYTPASINILDLDELKHISTYTPFTRVEPVGVTVVTVIGNSG